MRVFAFSGRSRRAGVLIFRMSDNFQYGDLVLLALVAVFVALRLRAMLGRGSGIDPRELWKQATREPGSGDKILPFAAGPTRKAAVEEEKLPESLKDNISVTDGIKAIRAVDAGFSVSDFLAGARLAFEWMVDAFAKGDTDRLRQLLSDERYTHFAAEIEARKAQEHKPEATIVSIVSTDITEAALLGTRAQVTVQFTSEQVHVTRGPDNQVIGGDPSALEKVIDICTFERDTASRDPNWKIVAT